jgi:hypothetical protein
MVRKESSDINNADIYIRNDKTCRWILNECYKVYLTILLYMPRVFRFTQNYRSLGPCLSCSVICLSFLETNKVVRAWRGSEWISMLRPEGGDFLAEYKGSWKRGRDPVMQHNLKGGYHDFHSNLLYVVSFLVLVTHRRAGGRWELPLTSVPRCPLEFGKENKTFSLGRIVLQSQCAEHSSKVSELQNK